MLFEVTANDVARLDDTELRTLIARLCEEEVRKLGFSPSCVTWGGHQNAADGGIDVRVDLPESSEITGFVPAAACGLQVKAQDMANQAILDEMAPKGALRKAIEDLAAKRGAYIIVSSHGSVADSALQDRRDAMRKAIDGKVIAGSLTIDFYDRQRLATWVNQHPGLIPWMREKVGRPLSGWRPFGDWSSSPQPLDKPYFIDTSVRLTSPAIRDAEGLQATDGVNHIRHILAKPHGIVRLVGLSGVGKTRLVQALFDERIGESPLAPAEAIYTDISNSPDPVPLELTSQLIHLRQRAVLIIDNCGPDLHQKLATALTIAGANISLITIEYDINDDEPENTAVFKLEVASIDLMEKILTDRFPDIPEPSRRIIAEFSSGNARIAFALAATAKNGESLANLRDRDLFERLFYQSKGKDQSLLNAAKVCALLYSFNGLTLEGPSSELGPLAKIAGLTADQLFAHVSELQRRQLIQKRGPWRAILPHAVAHRLTKLALQDIPFPRIDSAIIQDGSERMLRSFSKRMGYLHDDEHGKFLAANWLGRDGLLKPIGKYSELGAALFTNIAPIDPLLTLAFIERAAESNAWFFGQENENRQEIIRVVRSIAYDPDLFDRSVMLLKRFALNPRDGRSDSAKDALQSLFFLYLSGTHAPPTQRAMTIRLLLESSTPAESALGLELLRAMLKTKQFSSHFSFDFGARSRDYGLSPRSRADIRAWYGQVLRVIEDVGMSTHPVASEVRKHLAVSFYGLFYVGMIDELISLAEKFSTNQSWPEGWIAVRAAIKNANGKAPEQDVTRLRELAAMLQPTELADLVRSYALSKQWGALDVANIDDGEESDPLLVREKILHFCVCLGERLAKDETQLDKLLPEILLSDSDRTYWLGKGLATECQSLSACWQLLMHRFLLTCEAQQHCTLLGGFLSEAVKRSPSDVAAILDGVLADPDTQSTFVYLQISAGLDDAAFCRLMAALKMGSVPLLSYMQLAYGRSHEKLTDVQILELSRLLSAKEGGPYVVGEIVGMRMFGVGKNEPSIGEVLKTAGRELLDKMDFEANNPHLDHLLGVIMKLSLDETQEELGHTICERIKEALQTYRISPFDLHDAIEALAKTCPMAVLDVLVEKGDDEAETGRNFFRDVRENRGCPLQAIPDESLIAWANTKPQTRFVALAKTVKYSDASEDSDATQWSSIAEKLIEGAPDAIAVLNVFYERFRPMGWSGSRAEIMSTRIPLLHALRKHTRPEVVDWTIVRTPNYVNIVESERASEVIQNRIRDERFEY